MAFKNIRAAARAVLNVINRIPVPTPFYPYHAALQAAQEANLSYQRKERQAKANAAQRIADVRNLAMYGRTDDEVMASIARKERLLRAAMQTPPDFFPSENTQSVHRPGRLHRQGDVVKEFQIVPGSMVVKVKGNACVLTPADVEFFEALRRTLGKHAGANILIEPAQARFRAYCDVVCGKHESFPKYAPVYYCIASDAEAAAKVLRMIAGGKIPNIYVDERKVRWSYGSYPAPMQGKYRMWEGKHNTGTPDGVYDVREVK